MPLQSSTTISPTKPHTPSPKLTHVDGKQDLLDDIKDKTKKMATNLEEALMKFIDSSPNKFKGKCSHSKHTLFNNDLSNFEQLVIMKKYPYLDLQGGDFNVGQLSNKNTELNSAQVAAADSNYCDAPDEEPTVEISNRGLSGFALPNKLTKSNTNEKATTKDVLDELRLIESLEEDIKKFEEQHRKFCNKIG